jgi:hypothetical protein
MSELALDHDQRYAFAGHLDGVGVPELVRREPSPYACRGGSIAQLDADARRRAWAPPRRTAQHAEQRADGK